MPTTTAVEKKEDAAHPTPALPVVPLARSAHFVEPHQQNHSAIWQAEMDRAFATFLEGVKTQLVETGALKPRPIVLTYATLSEEEYFIECTLIASDPANPDKVHKLLPSVERNGALVFERKDQVWLMHYRQGKSTVQSFAIEDPSELAQLDTMAQSGDLRKGFAVSDPLHLQTIVHLAGSLVPDAVKEAKKGGMSEIAQQLAGYLAAAGLPPILNAIDFYEPEEAITALKSQLDQEPDTQVIVLSTPAYKTLANDQNKRLSQLLVEFGKDKKDSVLLLMCLGGSATASQILPRHFLYRDCKALLRSFDGPQGGMPDFLDMFGELSGKNGLGLLPDVLDLEGANSPHTPLYAALFTELSQTQARLTTDHTLEEALDTQFYHHPLRGFYPDTQGMQVEAQRRGGEEKETRVADPLTPFLADSHAKTALLLAPTLADTELSGLAVVDLLRQHPSRPRVIAIDLSEYPGRAAGQCVALTLRHTLKLPPPMIQQLQHHALKEPHPRQTVLVFKNYQHTGSYDNLYVKNALAAWPGIKIIVTCTGDYFNRHDPAVCFLSDPTNPDRASLQQWRLTPFATQAAQAATLHLSPTPLENLDTLLTESGLSPKRQAQQVELDRFLDQIKTELTSALPLNARNAFISYAWEPNAKDLSRQQRHLRQLAHDLGRAGFPTWLDIERMTGDINAQMAQNIQNSRYALIIGTPRYTQRATVLLNGQPTNVKREYDDILKGHQEKKLEVLALTFLPPGPFDGGKKDETGKIDYPSFPETMPALPQFDLLNIDEVETYLHCLTDEQHGLLPQLLHLAERSPEERALYQTAKASLKERLQLLPAEHLILAQAEHDQRIYEIEERRKLYIEARAKAEEKEASPEFNLTAQFDAFLSRIAAPVQAKENAAEAAGEGEEKDASQVEKAAESKDELVSMMQATTFLALGSGGSGKSLFAQIQYARLVEPWLAYKKDPETHPRPAWIPVYIPLKHYVGKWEATPENQAAGRAGQPRVNTCVETALRETYRLDERDIEALKTGSGQSLGVLLILDGYDELSGETPHLYNLNGLARWSCPLKLLVTSRIDYIPDPEKHKGYFAIGSQTDSFVRSYIQPFSFDDIERYIQLYESQILIQQSQAQAARDAASGVLAPAAAPQGDTYQTLEKLPGLLGLVKNPFLLNLVLQGLPYLVAQRAAKEDSRSVTRFAIYDSFSQYWFGKEVFRLVKQDDPALRLQFEQHAERLAFQLFLNQQLSVSEKGPQDADLWGQFFNAADSEVAKARAALPIRDAGDQQYEFMHKTLFEYFVARHFVNAYDRAIAGQPHPNPVALGEALAARPSKDKARHAGGVPLPVQDGGVFNFLKDAIETGGGERNFKVALFEQVKRSATLEGQAEPEIGGPRGLAAAHAATILTKTGTSMANQAWRGVQLPGADLGLASLAHSDLSGTNLKGAYLVGTFLYGADLSRANLKEVRFMEYPKITLQESVRYFALYPSVTARRARPWIVIGQENEIIIIDQNTGEVLGRRESHDDRVNYVAFSPQGDRVVSGSYNTLRFWEVSDTGGDLTPQGVLRGREANVYAYVFSPEGDRMVSRGQANTLCLWSVGRDVTRELMPQAVLQEQENYVTACAFSPTGDRLVSIGQGNTLCLWSVGRDVTGELTPQAVLRGHEDDVTACEFSPRGDRVVSASNDQTLCLWKVEKNASGELTPQAVLRGHEAKVNACAFSPEGDRVVSGSEDGTLRLWSVGDDVAGELSFYAVLRGHGDGVVACAFSPEGDRVMSSSYDATLRWWLAGKGTVGELMPQMVLRGHERAVNACSFNPTGDRMVSGSYDKTLRLWKVTGFPDDFAPQAVLRGQEAWVNACAFSPEGDRVVSGSDDGTLRLWSVEGDAAGELMPQVVLRGHEAEVYACAFSPRDDWVVSASRDTTLRLWKVTEAIGELASSVVLRGHNEGVRACAFSFEGKRLVSASEDQTLRLWRVGRKATETLASYAVLRGHEGGVFACAFSPEGGRVVSGSDDGTLRLWSVEGDAAGELMPQVVLRGHEAGVTACVFSPKGDRVVSSSLYDKTLRVWDVGSISQATCIQVVKWCALITSLDIHPRHYRSMAASSSETCFTGNAKAENSNIIQIVVGDDAGLMSLWQLEDQQVHFRGMPLQPGMTNVWRATWQTVKLAGTQVTNLVKALLEQYRERPLEEGGEENQVQLVAYSSEEETKEEGVRVQSAGAAVAVESASATQSTLEKETCYWVFPTSNKKATAKGILDTLKGLPLDRRPVVNKNCFTSQADAEKQLAFLFEKKSISKGGFCKGFIFCADASAAEFAKLAIGDTEGAKKLFVNVSAYSYNREAKQLTEIEKTSLALEKESVEHSQALACSS